MERKEAIDQLREIQEMADIEIAHRLADDILCRLLHSLCYADVGQNLLNTDLINEVFEFYCKSSRCARFSSLVRCAPIPCVITITSDRSFISNQ